MVALTALGKKPKGAGALGSNFIHENYTAADRNHDFMGQPERKNPVYAAPRPVFKDPAKFKVVEGDHFKAVRKQLQWVAEFRNHVKSQDLLKEREIQQPVPHYVPFLAPKPEVIEDFHAVAKAKTEAHRAWMAKEHADMAVRRLAHLLQGV